MNFQWSREQKWNRVLGKDSVFERTFRKTPNCDVCLKTEITRASCRRRALAVMPRAENFVDLITEDHKVLSEESGSRNNHRCAVVVQDLATQWLQSYLCKTKTSQETQKNLMKFLELTRKPKVTYTGDSLEFGKSCEDLSWNHCTSTPHRSETHGIAEREVRRVKEGTSAVLLQSGLDENWWADSMGCHCYLRNIQDLLSDGKTPNERGFGIPFNGPVVPFGAMVEYHPISAKDLSRLHEFGPKMCQVKSLAMRCTREESGKETPWSQIEELEEMVASELHGKRLNAKEVLRPMRGENFIFPIADGTVKLSGGDQDLRTSTLIRDRPDRGEEQGNHQGESDRSSSTPLQDSSW